MKISPACIALIKQFEGLRTDAYLDACGVCTIGFGHTDHVELGQSIDAGEAERLLAHDLETFEAGVNGLLKVPVTQGQFDALVSFAFNLGIGTLQRSTLVKLVNLENFPLAAAEFPKWVFAGRRALPGLVKRRAAEQQLFLS